MSRVRNLIMGIALIVPFGLMAQRQAPPPAAPATDTSRPAARTPSKGPKPYREVVTAKAVTDDGMFKVHVIEDRYLAEIPDSLFGRDILLVSRVSKAAAGGRNQAFVYAGDDINSNVIRFRKGPENKVFLKLISHQEVGSDTTADGMYRSVMNSNMQPLAAAFDIKAYSADSAAVIDLTDYIKSDNDVLFFSAGRKRGLNLGAMQADRSYIEGIRSFPTNVEIRTVKTYLRTAAPSPTGAPAAPGGGPATYELNSSMTLLPKVPMKPRHFDPRVGYFATRHVDFDANPQGVKTVSHITRWRLEPKEEDIAKYLRGELVEPKKPIIFYIDPATPKKWVPYLIQGVNDWQIAFEQAGFKNAIIGLEAPDNPEWSIEDARHSAIVYKPSDIPNASGPHKNDPRSGEIMESHINWYHNVMSLLRNWYFVQTAAVDPKARGMVFEDELMGQLIRFVSSHEVGHTIGLRHNYGSSSTTPVEKLRDKAWVEANGHTPSIMDYARFNYVAQPEDNISQKGLFPRIGDYDKWAIEWGYRWYPDNRSASEEAAFQNKLIMDSLSKNPRLIFGTESDPNDPRFQNEDLGDNSMLASHYGIKNLKRIIPKLEEWTRVDNESYGNLSTMYLQVVTQFNRYMGHVSKHIGGISTTPKTVEQDGAVVEFASKATQKEAVKFLHENLFTTPSWLIDKKIFAATGTGDISTISGLQENTLGRLFSAATLNKLLQAEAFDAASAYTVSEFLRDMKTGIWSELPGRKTTDMYRRNLQKIYAERLIALITPAPTSGTAVTALRGFSPSMSKTNDAMSLVKGHARSLAAEIKAAIPAVQHQATRMHLQDVHERLTAALDPK